MSLDRFQWTLFVINGFGWVVDNFWSQGITAIRPDWLGGSASKGNFMVHPDGTVTKR